MAQAAPRALWPEARGGGGGGGGGSGGGGGGGPSGVAAPAPAPAGEPPLPQRWRRAPGADEAAGRQRVFSGTACLLWLGRSRLMQATGATFAFGTVVSWCRPWFNVAFDDGRTVNVCSVHPS